MKKMMTISDLIDGRKKDNPKLRGKLMKDGRYSLYLDLYYGTSQSVDEQGNTVSKTYRQKEFLNLYVSLDAKTQKEKDAQKETIALAQKIRAAKEQEFIEDKTGYRLTKKDKNFIVYMDNFVANRKNADYKIFQMAQRAFKNFLKESYPQYVDVLTPTRLNSTMVEDFVDYIRDNYNGSTPLTIYKRWKQIINKGIKEKFFRQNPCTGITIPSNDGFAAKDILSQEEEKRLFATHYAGENLNIRRGFAITCCTGMRYCDVVRLTYSNIDYSNRLLIFDQQKVAKDSSCIKVFIPLDDNLLNIIGEKPSDKSRADLILDMPSHTMCLKALRRWTAEAGIDKHITWHCGRHSFATNLLLNNNDIKTVSTLLGHSTLKYTQQYVRATDQAKMAAISSVSNIFSASN